MNNLATLLKRSANKDQTAFKLLYEQTSPKLYGLALRIMKRKSVAEEVLQESYLKIWNRADRYHYQKSNVLGWMSTITRNTALDALRALSSRPQETGTLYEGSDFSSLANTPEENMDQLNRLHNLERQLQKLSPVQRQNIIYSYYYGYSHQELSEMQGKPLGTIKAWIRRGNQHLHHHASG